MSSKRVYVGSLPFSLSQDDVSALFAPCGTIVAVELIKDKQTGRSKGFAFIEFETEEAAQKAKADLHQKEVLGRKILVNDAHPQVTNSSPQNRGRGGYQRRGGYRGGNRSGGGHYSGERGGYQNRNSNYHDADGNTQDSGPAMDDSGNENSQF